ncbi:hypothetical protein VPG91_06120 [Nitrospirillum amazonense]|uniref:hypothetical protein n=1 Tax=Nitrospirillum amazonense TaxID=28077 RepID=UPI002DD42824|nr:hypothetical protein [Nitrospirillum amazonense]MEC4590555.1 hypothetical protein [Nitrospirillum amazonense]
MTTPTAFPTATPEQAAALADLRAAFSRFALTGGLDLDDTHVLGSAHLAVLDLADKLAATNRGVK